MTAMKQQSESDSSMFEDWSSNELNWKLIRKLRIFGPNKRNLSKKETRKKNSRVHYQYSLKLTK
jgi:Cft2 family RNA processing exonuclease